MMPKGIHPELQAREVVHLALLARIAERVGDWNDYHSNWSSAIALRGGVALRLQAKSPRYSEDIDIDAVSGVRRRLKKCVTQFLEEPAQQMVPVLRPVGIREIEYQGQPKKDTSKALKYDFRIKIRGGIILSTKIEFSFRSPNDYDTANNIDLQPRLRGPHLRGVKDFMAPIYTVDTLMRQKIDALGDRAHPVVRDVFDIYHLHTLPDEYNFKNMAAHITNEALKKATSRCLAFEYKEYQDKVIDFLPNHQQKKFDDQSTWEEIQLRVSQIIESIQEHKLEHKKTSPRPR